jgi:hypothetical protein
VPFDKTQHIQPKKQDGANVQEITGDNLVIGGFNIHFPGFTALTWLPHLHAASPDRYPVPLEYCVFFVDLHVQAARRYRLRLLRTVGPVYRFRHAEIQDHLATAYRPLP